MHVPVAYYSSLLVFAIRPTGRSYSLNTDDKILISNFVRLIMAKRATRARDVRSLAQAAQLATSNRRLVTVSLDTLTSRRGIVPGARSHLNAPTSLTCSSRLNSCVRSSRVKYYS